MIVAPPPARDLEPTSPPSLSVIVAAHDAAATIGASVASALEQTRPPREVVVCDDGSTDDLASALAPFGDRVTLVRQSHRGPAAARNRAAAEASGDFVVVLDADDAYHPRRLEALGDLLAARPDLDLATTDVVLERDGSPVARFYEENEFDVADQRAAILRGCFPGGWPAVRRSALLAAGGYDERLRRAEDWDLWIRLILGGSRAGLVAEPLMTYRLHEGSLSADRVESLRARVTVLEKAACNPDLRPAERPVVASSLASYRRRLGLAELDAAFAQGARGPLLRGAFRRGVPARRRLAALRRAAAGSRPGPRLR